MKTNKIMRIASGLLVAVLLSTCVISGTFAKYVSTYDGTDSARVATWAFEIDGEALANDFKFDLFNAKHNTQRLRNCGGVFVGEGKIISNFDLSGRLAMFAQTPPEKFRSSL